MVRHKTRWLLVRLEFDSDIMGKRDEGDSRNRNKGWRVEEDGAGLTKKDLAQCIRECISSSFGVAASGLAQDVQGMTISCMIWLEGYCYRLSLASHNHEHSFHSSTLRRIIEIVLGTSSARCLRFDQGCTDVSNVDTRQINCGVRNFC